MDASRIGVTRIRTAVGLALATALAALAGCGVQPPVSQPTVAPATHRSTTASRPATSAPASPTTGTSSATAPATTTPDRSCPKPASGFLTRAPGTGKTVALTFDDGPGPADSEIVAVLAANHVHATFFATGLHASQRPDQVTANSAAGNLIGNHTWDHLYPSQVSGGWTATYLRSQLTRTNAELTSLTGQPTCYFRPPGGFRTNVLATANKLGMTAVLWSTDTEDWQQPGRTTAAATAKIVANATRIGGNTHPIVLMHSAKASHEPNSQVSPYRGNTIAALPKIIRWYRNHGYRFVLLDGRS
jgi:peptidoglycan/xylan/chitin deacetylase (PgdA/CDA1 family)